MIKQLMHVALRVADIQRARTFYEGVLGFEPSANRPNLSVAGIWYECGSVQLHLLGSTQALFTCEVLPHPGQEAHIAFAVAHIELAKHALQQAGIPFVMSRSGRKALFCRDPDGNVLELAEA